MGTERLATNKRQLEGLTTLLALEKEARHAPDLASLGFLGVNETLRLLPYEQALFWRKEGLVSGQTCPLSILCFSGVTRFDAHAPQVVWYHNLMGHLASQAESLQCHTLSDTCVDPSQQEAWREWSPAHVLWVPLIDPHHGALLGGLWLARDQVWTDGEQRLAEHWADGYGHALALLTARSKRRFWTAPMLGKRLGRMGRMVWVGCLLVGLLWLPVRQSVLAPATVVAKQPILISAPTDGVVYRFHVLPNQTVVVGQKLFDLDPTEVNHQFQVATEALAVAKAHYQKAESKATQRSENGGELASLRALMARSATQARYAKQLLQRLQVIAPVAGVVMFSDVNQWLGRPVRVGERILSMADPTQVEVEILLPVADALVLEPGAETRLFLNIDPLHPKPGKLRYASYEASATPEGMLAYRLRSAFSDKNNLSEKKNHPRLGLKGTAKLFGEKVPLFLYLFRRPLSALRQRTGW